MTIVDGGITSRSEYFNLVDKTAGTPKTGATITQLIIGYTRTRQGNVTTTCSALPNTSAAWSSGGAIEIDGTNAPGLYRVDVPDAAYSTGADTVILTLYANTTTLSVAPSMKEVQIDVIIASVTGNVGGAVGSVVGNVGGSVASVTGNVGGSVGSVVGNVGGSVGSVVASVLANSVTGNVGGSVGSVVGNVGGAVSAVGTTVTASVSTNNDKTGYSLTQSFPANFSSLAITAGGAVTAGTVIGNVGGSVGSVVGNVGGSVGSVIASVLANSVTGNVGGSVGSVVGNVGGSVSAVGTTVTAAVSTNNDKTGYSTTDFTTVLTESYRANGAQGTPAQILYEILGHHAEKTVSGVTVTTKKIDHSAVATTLTLDATTPSSVSRAT